MKSKIQRVCEVNHGSYFSICELHHDELNNYFVNVKLDPENLFVDFNIENTKKMEKERVIKNFEEECLNRFTCYGEFTVDYIKEENQEVIRFFFK